MLPELPADRGTYILLLRLDEPTSLTVGRLGRFAFAAGWYAYAGSAFGSGGLRARLKHHLYSATRHWHIDYLREVAPVQAIWYLPSAMVYEHAWAAALYTLPDAALPARRFGASDCTCPAHLVYFSQRPAHTLFCEVVSLPVRQWWPIATG